MVFHQQHRKLILRKDDELFFILGHTNFPFRYRKTTIENEVDDDDEFGRDKAEIVSDHDSDEIDYPDEEVENNDD